MRRIPLLILILCAAFATAFSQGEIPVDMYTGQPSITIPIWTVSSGDVSVPVVLSYNANSASQETFFGMGWNISTGSISREVRNFPDDVGYNMSVRGWFYKNPSNVTIATDVGNFTPAADNSTTWDSGEGTDHTKISGWYNESGANYVMDTEPDIFNYSVGGLSGSFVFDNALTIRTIPYADVVITPTYTSANDRRITSFTITTNTGYIYTFAYTVPIVHGMLDLGSAPVQAKLYATPVSYVGEWKLTRIDSPEGGYVTINYSLINDNTSSEVYTGLYQYPDPFFRFPTDIINRVAYTDTLVISKAYITSITGSTGSKATFNYHGRWVQSIVVSDDRRGTTTAERKIKEFTFEYLPVTYALDEYAYEKLETDRPVQFLTSMQERSGCDIKPPYTFKYAGIFTVTDFWTREAGSYLKAFTGSDQWGFSNHIKNEYPYPRLYIYPSEPMKDRYRTSPIPGDSATQYEVPGANRNAAADPTGVMYSLTNPEGGTTEFAYESNKYLDPRSNTNVPAGGVRVRSIIYYDGYNPEPVIKTFEYVDPTTGLSSGRIIRKPGLAMPALKWRNPGSTTDNTYQTSGPTTEEKYQHLLIRSASNLGDGETTQGNTVGYKIVTVRRPGAGYARFEYLVPATYGDPATGDWAPTINKFARNTASSSVQMGVIDTANTWGFPYSPNPNYDFERGLISKKSDYTSDDKLVQQTITTYQRLYKSGTSPSLVGGLHYDMYPGSDPSNKIFFYGRYNLLTDVICVPAKEVTIRYDLADGTGATKQKDSVEYLYESSNHKLLTQIKRYTTDGDVYATRIKYPKDYTTTSASGATDAVAIHTLKSNNRHGLPIETIQTVKKAGNDTVWVIGGSVVKLDPFSGSVIRTRSSWALKASPPIDYNSFVPSTVVNSGGYKFRIDSRYEKTDSVLQYTALGNVLSAYSPLARKNSAAGYSYGNTVPVVQLAGISGTASFSNFESSIPGFSWSSGTPYYGTGRTGKNAFYPGVTLVDTLSKAAVSNYILSFWINSNASVSFSIDLKNTSGTALSPAASTSFSVASTGGTGFVYVQKIIPIPSHVPATFRVEFKATGISATPAGGSAPGLLPVIDDVFFYPENAAMSASTFEIPFGATSVTSGTGNTLHTEYDKLGRPRIVYDKDKNIISRTVYQYVQNPFTADFSITGMSTESATTFTAVVGECVTDATYEWDLGEGFTAGSSVLNHTYDTLGSYTVSMRVTSITYGTKTVTKSFTVSNSSFYVGLCAKGGSYYLNNLAEAFESCSYIPGTVSSGIKFFAPSTGGVSYQWKMREVGSSSWTDVGKNSATYDFHVLSMAIETYRTFEIKCRVTNATGSISYSPTMTVTFEYN